MLDSKHGTNAAGISSSLSSHASTSKAEAPSVMERVPALAGPGVDSPAACSSTKTVEKRCPPLADRSHQSATSPVLHWGGWSHGTDLYKDGRGGSRAIFSSALEVVANVFSPWSVSAAKTCLDVSALWGDGGGALGCDSECRTIHWSARLKKPTE